MINKYIEYLYNLDPGLIKYNLENIEILMRILGNPQDKLKYIHITGTNGKGSTSKYIQNILTNLNFKTGLYTSPHLKRFNERIKIDGIDISDESLMLLIKEIKEKVSKYNINKTDDEKLFPSFFEFTTAIAFLYFEKQKVEYVVLEVGLGGRLDATNIIKNPLISIITNISLDHTEILGNRLEEICYEKCGIIKENVTVITTEQNLDLLKIIKDECDNKNANLISLKNDLENFEIIEKNLLFQEYKIYDEKIKIRMLGTHQIYNSYLAYTSIIKLLELEKIAINKDKIKNALYETFWPARIQIINNEPLKIIDAAHNKDGIKYLNQFLEDSQIYKKQNKKLLIALSKISKADEDLINFLNKFDEIIITENGFKKVDSNELYNIIKLKINEQIKIITMKNSKLAYEKIQENLDKEDFLLITGSLYLIGEII